MACSESRWRSAGHFGHITYRPAAWWYRCWRGGPDPLVVREESSNASTAHRFALFLADAPCSRSIDGQNQEVAATQRRPISSKWPTLQNPHQTTQCLTPNKKLDTTQRQGIDITMFRKKDGSPMRTRTSIDGVRVRSLTIRGSGNVDPVGGASSSRILESQAGSRNCGGLWWGSEEVRCFAHPARRPAAWPG